MGRYAGEEYGDDSVSQDSWRALKTQHRMMEDRALKTEAERDRLQTRIDKALALCDIYYDGDECHIREKGERCPCCDLVDDLRALLSEGTPSEVQTKPNLEVGSD
jgi:hypothetical protein